MCARVPGIDPGIPSPHARRGRHVIRHPAGGGEHVALVAVAPLHEHVRQVAVGLDERQQDQRLRSAAREIDLGQGPRGQQGEPGDGGRVVPGPGAREQERVGQAQAGGEEPRQVRDRGARPERATAPGEEPVQQGDLDQALPDPHQQDVQGEPGLLQRVETLGHAHAPQALDVGAAVQGRGALGAGVQHPQRVGDDAEEGGRTGLHQRSLDGEHGEGQRDEEEAVGAGEDAAGRAPPPRSRSWAGPAPRAGPRRPPRRASPPCR